MHLLIYPSVIHSYYPYIVTDDLQQMTPVCIISSVVVGLEPPHVNLRTFLWYYSIIFKYAIINGYLDQVLKYSGTYVLKY